MIMLSPLKHKIKPCIVTVLTNQDYELFRIWDSCELEDFEENSHEYSFKFDSVNSEEQTGALMILSLTK